MSFGIHKVILDPYSSSTYTTYKSYSEYVLGKVVTLFTNASSKWSVEDDIAQVVDGASSSYSSLTVMFKNDDTNNPTYVRVWYFFTGGSYSGSLVDEPIASTASSLKVYRGNTFVCESHSSILGNYNGLYFAVSTNGPIGKDPGLDLNLSVPLFSYSHSDNTSSITMTEQSAYYSKKKILTIVTNGEMFNMFLYTETNGYKYFITYANDLFINANTDDTFSCGVLFSKSSSSFFTTSDSNSDSNSVFAVFTDSNGKFNFDKSSEYYASNNYLAAAHNLPNSYLTSYPPLFYMNRQTGISSDEELVYNKIGIKGWINPEYVRRVASGQLSSVDVNTLFGNRHWYCASTSTLFVWDGSTTYSPFSESF